MTREQGVPLQERAKLTDAERRKLAAELRDMREHLAENTAMLKALVRHAEAEAFLRKESRDGTS